MLTKIIRLPALVPCHMHHHKLVSCWQANWQAKWSALKFGPKHCISLWLTHNNACNSVTTKQFEQHNLFAASINLLERECFYFPSSMFFLFFFFIFFFIITNLNGIEWSNNPVSFIETLLLAIFANQRNLFVQREVDVKFALGIKNISCGFYPWIHRCVVSLVQVYTQYFPES